MCHKETYPVELPTRRLNSGRDGRIVASRLHGDVRVLVSRVCPPRCNGNTTIDVHRICTSAAASHHVVQNYEFPMIGLDMTPYVVETSPHRQDNNIYGALVLQSLLLGSTSTIKIYILTVKSQFFNIPASTTILFPDLSTATSDSSTGSTCVNDVLALSPPLLLFPLFLRRKFHNPQSAKIMMPTTVDTQMTVVIYFYLC